MVSVAGRSKKYPTTAGQSDIDVVMSTSKPTKENP